MFPNVHIGSAVISSFSITMLAAFLAGGWLGDVQARYIGIDPALSWRLLPWAAVVGVLGSKLYPLLFSLPSVLRGEQPWWPRGEVWYGGVIAGALVVMWRFRCYGYPLHWLLDYDVVCVGVGHAIGRIGCFLVGDDYGLPTSAFIGVRFPHGAPPSTAGNLRAVGVSIPADVPGSTVLAVLPTQLFESVALLIISAIVWRASRQPHRKWSVAARYMMLYAGWRFIVEFMRAKDDRIASGMFAGLTVGQLLSVAIFAGGAALWARHRNAVLEPSPPPMPVSLRMSDNVPGTVDARAQ
jgi:phosphatidylglycerol:prolipoprotein diacylglycerol transferase